MPLGGVVIAVALRVLPADRPAAAPPLDLWGALLLAALLGWTSLLLADVTGGDLTWTLTGAGLTVVLLVSLVYVERRHRLPVLPGLLLKRRPVAVANAVLMLNAGATTAAIYFTTLTMQHTMGYGPLQTGLGFAPVTAVVLLTSPRAGALASRLGARLLLLIGSGVSALGLLLLGLTASPGVGYWGGVLPGLALVAAGNGLSYAPPTRWPPRSPTVSTGPQQA